MAKKKSRKQDGNLTLSQKAQIVSYHAQHHGDEIHHTAIAKWATKEFNLTKPLHRTTVGRILNRKDEYTYLTPFERNSLKNRHPVTNTTLEIAVKN